MERILIIGGNGSGKTTFAQPLSQKLGLPLVHLDRLYWRDGWESASAEEFLQLLQKELEKPRWVIDGNIHQTLPLRLGYCDTVLFFDFSRLQCLLGVIRRTLQNLGKSRPDMGGNCPEKLGRRELRFWASVWRGHPKSRARFYSMLKQAPDIRVVVLKNRRQAQAFLRSLPQAEKPTPRPERI